MNVGTDMNTTDAVNNDKSLLLTAEQCAELLNIGKSTFWRYHTSGKVPMPVKIGRSIRWRTEEIHDWVEAGCPSREQWNVIREG